VGFLLLAVLEEEEGGDGLDAVLGGEGAFLVDVDLQDLELAAELGGDVVEEGGDGLAGAAPLGPEVDEDDGVSALELGVEIGRRDILNVFAGHGWGDSELNDVEIE